LGNAAVGAINEANTRSEAQQQAQLEATAQQMESSFSNELQGDIDAQMAQTGAQAMANMRAQGQATLDQEYANTDQTLENRLASMPDPSLTASIAALGNGGGGSSDLTSTMSPLELQVMDANPNSPGYAQLQRQWFAQEFGGAYSTPGDIIGQELPVENLGSDAGVNGGTRAPVHSLYLIGPGPFDQAYAAAAGIADDPNNTSLQKAGGFLLAAAESPLKLLEDTGRSILMVPAAAYISGQYVGAAISDQDSFRRWNDIAQASGAFGQALMGATILGGAAEGTVTRSMLGSDAKFVAPEVVPDSEIAATAGPKVYPGFTDGESQVINEAQGIINSPELSQMQQANAAGQPLTVTVNGRLIQYEPDLPASGMTMFGENGFLIGPEAFTSQDELQQTVLHELYRLNTSASADGVSGSLAAQETQAAADFAARANQVIQKP
jgi:hypothetical protein